MFPIPKVSKRPEFFYSFLENLSQNPSHFLPIRIPSLFTLRNGTDRREVYSKRALMRTEDGGSCHLLCKAVRATHPGDSSLFSQFLYDFHSFSSCFLLTIAFSLFDVLKLLRNRAAIYFFSLFAVIFRFLNQKKRKTTNSLISNKKWNKFSFTLIPLALGNGKFANLKCIGNRIPLYSKEL